MKVELRPPEVYLNEDKLSSLNRSCSRGHFISWCKKSEQTTSREIRQNPLKCIKKLKQHPSLYALTSNTHLTTYPQRFDYPHLQISGYWLTWTRNIIITVQNHSNPRLPHSVDRLKLTCFGAGVNSVIGLPWPIRIVCCFALLHLCVLDFLVRE